MTSYADTRTLMEIIGLPWTSEGNRGSVADSSLHHHPNSLLAHSGSHVPLVACDEVVRGIVANPRSSSGQKVAVACEFAPPNKSLQSDWATARRYDLW